MAEVTGFEFFPGEDEPVVTCATFFDDAVDTELQEEFVQRPDE